LAEQAVKEGATLFVNTNATSAITDSSGKITGIKANLAKEEIVFQSRVVIDASGFQSVVAKSLGLVSQWKKFGAGAEYEATVENIDSDTWYLMVGQKYSPSGYAWIFPVGGNKVRIGVGVGKPDSNVDPTQRLDEIIEKKLGPIKKLGKISPIEFHYGLIPNDGLVRKTAYDNLILVGDAAGYANPLVLEGIRYAIKFGRVAGKVAADAIKANDTSEKMLSKYEENWRKAVSSKINSAYKVQSRWIGLSDEQWDKEIEIINELSADEFLDFIRADFGLSSIIKLAAHHPKLAVRQLFGMVKAAQKN
jgi:digeranylgeranylglycerophospholipid reductase